MEYKVGDWVQLVDKRPKGWVEKMDDHLGKVVKIVKIEYPMFRYEGQHSWCFLLEDISGYAKNKIVQDIIQDL